MSATRNFDCATFNFQETLNHVITMTFASIETSLNLCDSQEVQNHVAVKKTLAGNSPGYKMEFHVTQGKLLSQPVLLVSGNDLGRSSLHIYKQIIAPNIHLYWPTHSLSFVLCLEEVMNRIYCFSYCLDRTLIKVFFVWKALSILPQRPIRSVESIVSVMFSGSFPFTW